MNVENEESIAESANLQRVVIFPFFGFTNEFEMLKEIQDLQNAVRELAAANAWQNVAHNPAILRLEESTQQCVVIREENDVINYALRLLNDDLTAKKSSLRSWVSTLRDDVNEHIVSDAKNIASVEFVCRPWRE